MSLALSLVVPIAAALLGRRLGLDHVLSFDMGGTTAKASLIERGRINTTSEYEVGGSGSGSPGGASPHGGSSFSTAARMSDTVSPANNVRPVSISKSTTPNA